MRRLLAWTILGAAIAVPARADHADDDLKVVRKAVQSPAPSTANAVEKARPPAEEEPQAQPRPALRSSDLKWLHLRVTPKAGSKSGRVSINLPLGIVRLLGDDWPVPTPGCRHHDRCHMTLGEILRVLDSGQTLVDIDDDEASVKVWVE